MYETLVEADVYRESMRSTEAHGRRRTGFQLDADKKPATGPGLFTCLSEIRPEVVQWLWQDRLPLGEISVVDGDPATSKSSAVLDLVARVSTGRPMPDGSQGVLGGALLLLAEDSIAKTVRQRLVAAGADLTRIAVMNGEVVFPGNLSEIQAAVVGLPAKLLVLDPFMAYLGVDGNKEQRVRKAMGPLKRLAEETNIAVVLVRHMTKGGGRNPLYRGQGSIGITAAVRSAFLVAKSPDDPHMRVLCHVKSNLGPLTESLLFEPVANGDGAVRVEWRGPCSYVAEDLLAPPRNAGGKLGEAKRFLLNTLGEGPVELDEIKSAAAKKSISFRTVERAKSDLGIGSLRRGFGKGSVLFWALPRQEAGSKQCHTHSTSFGGVWTPEG